MNRIKATKLVEFSALALALFLSVMTVSTASAKEAKPKKSGPGSQVVAHIPFNGMSVVDMAMQKQIGDKRYLYVQHGREEGISVIDVSDPAKAKFIRTIPWPNTQVSNRMNVLGDVALISETDSFSASQSKKDVVIWDLSDPASPAEMQKFPGVVKVLEDDHDFIYLLNADGLWVIAERPRPAQQDDSGSY